MTLSSKIRLSGKFGKPIYVVSAIVTLVMAVFVVLDPILIDICILLKLTSIPVIFYLFASSACRQKMFFYLNLGISRSEYYIIPFAVDFIAFALLMIISGFIGHAIP